MMYLVTDGGVKFYDDDYNPITLDAALVTVRRISDGIEAMYAEQDAAVAVDSGAQPATERTEAA